MSVASIAAFKAGSLPAETVGSSYDISVPGPQLGSTHELVVGPDGNFWFTQQLQDRVGRMTYDGQFTFFSTGEGSQPHGIKFDAQDRLWITRQASNTITQMDLNGNIIANHTIPSPGANPHGLTVARDGKVWFTGREGNLIGYFDPSTNGFKLYDLPEIEENPNAAPDQHGNFPIYIDEAPDGTMYFTDLLTSRVGRITREGVLTEYPLPSKFGPAGNARPIAVYVREDGVAVVSEESGHAYAYVLASGAVEELPLTPADAQAAALTYDRLGTLWVQYNTPDQIGRVELDGSLTPFPIPTTGAVQHRIIIGPDGELWFTELAKDKIGRMVSGHASGPAIDGVIAQKYQAKGLGATYHARFVQGKNRYQANYGVRVIGKGTKADRATAIFDFRRNLQNKVNGLAASANKPTYGLKFPAKSGDGITSRFRKQGGIITFVQRETIGNATYVNTFKMTIGKARGTSTTTTNISSATAHDLEAIKVLTDAS